LNIYETDKLLAEYLLFHYGSAGEILPYPFGPHAALDFPARCVTECVDRSRVGESGATALDLGCAVGRATFELARLCTRVIGIDRSQQFIHAAQTLKETGALSYLRTDEGSLTTPLVARVPPEIDRGRVEFQVGDATDLQGVRGNAFDIVVMANLIDRVDRPRSCLAQLSSLVKQGGQLVITSPYTWLEEFTPRAEWLGGYVREDGAHATTLDGLRASLTPAFTLIVLRDLPFLIREHARKFQWSVAQVSLWVRN
jgi:putative 4-mercaptohistidine N1-methyltranferase